MLPETASTVWIADLARLCVAYEKTRTSLRTL
jgi:hypothetical protein